MGYREVRGRACRSLHTQTPHTYTHAPRYPSGDKPRATPRNSAPTGLEPGRAARPLPELATGPLVRLPLSSLGVSSLTMQCMSICGTSLAALQQGSCGSLGNGCGGPWPMNFLQCPKISSFSFLVHVLDTMWGYMIITHTSSRAATFTGNILAGSISANLIGGDLLDAGTTHHMGSYL